MDLCQMLKTHSLRSFLFSDLPHLFSLILLTVDANFRLYSPRGFSHASELEAVYFADVSLLLF